MVCNQIKRNKSQTWFVLSQDKFIYEISSQYQTIRKSPDTPDKSGEICFGRVKYFNFFLINMFKFLQKYKNVW